MRLIPILLLLGERADVGDPNEHLDEAVEQTKAVLPYRSILVHDKYVFEESVDGRLEFGKGGQGAGVVVACKRLADANRPLLAGVVEALLGRAEKRGVDIADLPLEAFRAASPLFEEDIVGALDLDAVVAARTTRGGTAPVRVAEQLRCVTEGIEADEAALGALTPVVEMGAGA